MAITVTHAFTSNIADDPKAAAAGEVLPSHWNAAHVVSGSTGRTILTQNTNYYVSTTGSDSNGGTNSTTDAWATLQHALNFISQNLDLAGFFIFINMGAGTFEGAFVPSFVGGGLIQVRGTGGTTVLKVALANASNPVILFFPLALGATIFGINNVLFDGSIVVGGNTATGLVADVSTGNTIYLGDYVLGGGTLTFKPGNGTGQRGAISSEAPSVMYISCGGATVDGSGTANGIPIIVTSQGGVIVDFTVWTFTNNPNFGVASNGGFVQGIWFGAYLGLGAAYSGAFTGQFIQLGWCSFASFDNSPLVGSSPSTIDPTCTCAFTHNEANGWGGIGSISKAGLPSTTELPVPGTAAVFKDTSGGGVYLAYNDAGTIKKVTLT